MIKIYVYETVSDGVTERQLREDKSHSAAVKRRGPDIFVPNEP